MSLAHKPFSITQTVANYGYHRTNTTQMWRHYSAAEQRKVSCENGIPVSL